MNRRRFLATTAAAGLLRLLGERSARADEMSPDVQKAVHKGLEYLNKTQSRDGHFEGNGGNVIYVDWENDVVAVVRWIGGSGSLNEFVGKIVASVQPAPTTASRH